ncbi:efflux RND transporter periplasmic adaptor subunit [Thalassococcus sp. S3]|uniref:efflux RND transporter periplasmic adaptor subunit n=1 Tax=Thalassococcus sp. S3 TaxID=2017482 RepID=UPI00102435A1|nr:HlyD family efflux transporter periplasmic adaptor subunit [Thalassococcus sp. S3]QBF33548.1 efflux transporter periplasmic adaptor subunit [Thalassococcus sp. S3]
MRFLRQSLIGVFLASVTLALLIYAGQLVYGAVQTRMADDRRPPSARERVFAVNVQVAQLESVSPILTAFGQIQSRRTLEMRAAVGGRVIHLADSFVEGGVVGQGDVLVGIDPANLEAALERVRNDLRDAEAEVRDADRGLILARDELAAAEDQASLQDRAFQRQVDLEARGVGTAASVEAAELSAAQARQSVLSRRQAEAQAEARVDLAATRLSRTRIALEEAERDLADTEITAPFSGSLSDVTVVEGRLVSQNEKLAELVDPNALEVSFRVSTAQFTRLLGPSGLLVPARVVVTLDGAVDLQTSGQINRASAGVGDVQTGRLLFARLEQAQGFKTGDFVTVSVEEPVVDRVARLPASALGADGAVLVLDADERLEMLPVDLIRRQGDDILVRGLGLEGRSVVTARTPLLAAGIKVRPLREDDGIPEEQAMLELSEERRARLVAFVEANTRMPDVTKARLLLQLAEPQVPTRIVERIEARMGG